MDKLSPSMKITKVCCQGCGFPLAVDESIRYATCNHCGSSLEVIHDETVTHIRILEKLERATDALADDVKILQLQNDVQLLDRDWEKYLAVVCLRNENGTLREPSDAVPSVLRGVSIVLGSLLCFSVFLADAPWIAAVAGLVLPFFGCKIADSYAGTVKDFRRAKARYCERRAGLLIAIAGLRKTPLSPPKRPGLPARLGVPFLRREARQSSGW